MPKQNVSLIQIKDDFLQNQVHRLKVALLIDRYPLFPDTANIDSL